MDHAPKSRTRRRCFERCKDRKRRRLGPPTLSSEPDMLSTYAAQGGLGFVHILPRPPPKRIDLFFDDPCVLRGGRKPSPPGGAVAQMAEQRLDTSSVASSSLVGSTNLRLTFAAFGCLSGLPWSIPVGAFASRPRTSFRRR